MSTVEIDASRPRRGAASDPAGGSGGEHVLASIRRLMRLADRAGDADEVARALAAELFLLLGADEVHLHWLPGGRARGDEESSPATDSVAAYLFGGEGRLAYTTPTADRQPGVAWVCSTGQRVSAGDRRELAAVMPRLAATGGAGCALLLPLVVRGRVQAVVVVAHRRPGSLDDAAADRAAALVDQAAAALALLRARAEAGTDAVTGSMNHRAMRRRLREEIDRAARTRGQLSCLLLDLDDFKLVNDRHGHPAGDALLREVSAALVGEFRAFDRVARYGGDEFVVILPNADRDSAAGAAERARQRLAALPTPDLTRGVHASIGVAQWRSPMTADDLLAACDHALLAVKRNGKGTVACAP
ncbi:MAG TPA: GGDEF domain-containing protein [Solirubrobacteraceae bacterium]|nr:GGDEF domain-containing protein [Solirubrobacteraceae bacterium]